MKCPYCSHTTKAPSDSFKTVNTRKRGGTVVRRRECGKCKGRFNTVEVVDEDLRSS